MMKSCSGRSHIFFMDAFSSLSKMNLFCYKDSDILTKPDTPTGDSIIIVTDTSAAADLKSGQSNRKRNLKKRRLKYGKNRNGFSSLKENWTGLTGSAG